MNTTEPGSSFSVTSNTESNLPNLTTTTSVFQPPSHSSDNYGPEFTIMVVLGLSLLLAGLAAFLAVCRPSQRDGDSEVSCGTTGESWTQRRAGGSQSSEPELKVWKRLGSYRRSYSLSFRRPPHRRPHERESESTHASQSAAQQTPQPESSVEPHLTTPCLFDYVTEI